MTAKSEALLRAAIEVAGSNWSRQLLELEGEFLENAQVALTVIGENPDITNRRLADVSGLSLARISRIMSTFGADGYGLGKQSFGFIARTRSPHDSRQTIMRLTNSGRAFLDAAQRHTG